MLLVCAVSTVVLTRAFLAATGYPQVGGSKLHIAHVLWGGLLLLTALIATLAFLNPAAKTIAPILGGVGFGLFIDEVGKFVTKDVDYFYRPAIAIIYVAFVVLFVIVRALSKRGFDATEATLSGLETLMRAGVGSLSEERKLHAIALLDTTGADSPLARAVRDLLVHAPAPDTTPLSLRVSQALARVWTRLTAHRLFRAGVFALLAAAALVSAAEAAWLLRHGFSGLTLSETMFVVTTLVSDAMLVAGALALRRSLLAALRWYDHAVLLQICVGQVFLYGSEQFAATANLVALLVLFGLLRWAIRYESARALDPHREPSGEPVG